MGLTIFGNIRTGHKFQNLEKLYQMKDYSIVGSSLMGTEIGIELHVDVKVGQHNGKPLIASYHIFEDAYGSYSYGIDEEDYSIIGKPERSYNCHSIEDISTFNGWDGGYVYKNIGGNGYRCIGTPEIREYDREKVKERAFWCLENHYIPELKEVFSLVKPVDEMKAFPDEENYDNDDEISDMLKTNGVTDRILAASGNFKDFAKKDIYASHTSNKKTLKKDVYFGYVYGDGGIHKGNHSPMVVLEGANAVAKFVCNKDTIGNDKLVTDTLDRMMFSTYGIYINEVGRNVDPEEVNDLIEKVKNAQSKIFIDSEQNNDNKGCFENEVNNDINYEGDEREWKFTKHTMY